MNEITLLSKNMLPENIDAFKELFYRQDEWQYDLYERIGRNQSDCLSKDKIVDENLMNAIEEIIEARREIPCRKYWNDKKRELPMDPDAQKRCGEEIIDVFHFLMTALIYMDFTYEDIQEILRNKMAFNDTRADHKPNTEV